MRQAGTAGGSAREKAEQIRRAAERWEQGAEGEERTAAELATLGPRGFTVFHDLRVPGSKANVDHLVIGPTGVFAVDSKLFSYRVSYNKGTLWVGRYPQTKKLQTTKWEADEVGVALGYDKVVAVQCILGMPVPPLPDLIEGVEVVGIDDLLPSLADGEAVLDQNQLTALNLRATATWGHPAVVGVAPVAPPPTPAPAPGEVILAAAKPSFWRRVTGRG